MAEQQQLQPGQTEEPAETGFFDRLFSGDKPLWIIDYLTGHHFAAGGLFLDCVDGLQKCRGNTAHYFFNQLKFIAIGFVIMWFVHRINYQRYVRFTVVLFILALGFMLLTFVIGVNLNSASRWIRIPIIGMTFQPSDFMRVTLVALLAQLARQTPEGDRQRSRSCPH
ncbi:MAG: FtsW/RodA/SpoVE family cell cycle protein [Alistipes indistinctus]